MGGPVELAGDKLRAIVERIEHVEDEIRELNEAKKEIYLEVQAVETRQHRPKLRTTTARLGQSCMLMQIKSYAPSGHYSAESIGFHVTV